MGEAIGNIHGDIGDAGANKNWRVNFTLKLGTIHIELLSIHLHR
jgi:hypothetical protein